MNLGIPRAALAATALLAALSLVPSTASAGKGTKPVVREFTGTVAAVKAGGKSFRLKRAGRPALQVRLVGKTRVAKGARPRKGRKLVVKARRGKRNWVARSVKLVPVVVDDETDDEALDTADDPADDLGDEAGDDLGDDFGDDVGDDLGDDGDLDLEDTFGDALGDSGDELS